MTEIKINFYKEEFLNKQKEDLIILLDNYDNKIIRTQQIEKLKIFTFMNTITLNTLIKNLELFKNNETANKVMKNEIIKNINQIEKFYNLCK